MAKELRWHKLKGSVADGTTNSDKVASFTNQTGDRISIKFLNVFLTTGNSTVDESATLELSKQVADQVDTNGSEGFELHFGIGVPSTGASATDGEVTATWGPYRFDEGELILDQGESIHAHIDKSSGGAATFRVNIGYVMM